MLSYSDSFDVSKSKQIRLIRSYIPINKGYILINKCEVDRLRQQFN